MSIIIRQLAINQIKYKSLKHVSLYMPYTNATMNGMIQMLMIVAIKSVFSLVSLILFPPFLIYIYDTIIERVTNPIRNPMINTKNIISQITSSL